jgi:glycosyltransferase involved in cell wall biosynthesis
MALALAFGKPLFVRHCGNWLEQATAAEHFWKFSIERLAGGRNVMLATGGGPKAPSERNAAVRWIFATSLTERELARVAAVPRRAWTGPRLIAVCRQVRPKGTWLVVESLPRLVDRYPGVHLDVVGDGPAGCELREQAARLGVADRVTFHGNVDHGRVLSLLQGADLFCFPTAAEGFPKVVLEALACGLPVIATPVSVLPHLLGAGCGYLLEERSVEALVRAVGACLDDRGRYAALSSRAVSVSRRYSLELWRDTIAAHLREAWGPLKSHA